MPCSAMVCGVQPSPRCTARSGRFWLNRKISFIRTPKICPVTSLARSLSRKAHIGAIFSGPICLIFSTRAFWASVSVGMVPIMRVHANGERPLGRTLKRPMSSAVDLGLSKIADQAGGRGEVHEGAALLLTENPRGGVADVEGAHQVHLDDGL